MVEGKNAVVANYFGIGDADLCRFNCGFETARNYSYGQFAEMVKAESHDRRLRPEP